MKKSLGAKTLLYPTPVLVVGSYDADGRPNVMTAAWGGIACSRPPCISRVAAGRDRHARQHRRPQGVHHQPAQPPRRPPQADYFGLVSGRDTDKFAATGLTPAQPSSSMRPTWRSSRSWSSASSSQVHELGLHTQFIGEVKDVKIDEDCLDDDGHIDVRKLDPIALALEAGGYFALGELIGPAFTIGKEFVTEAGS